jgi:hypothetical protein
MVRRKEEDNMATEKVLKYWCWICHTVRNHAMVDYKGVPSEKGICMVCRSVNYAPQGDID